MEQVGAKPEAMARYLHADMTEIKRWINGEARVPQSQQIIIATYLKENPDELFRDTKYAGF